jgi:ubiquinone/menaquinone biosynthesis C-methylase UbiE
VVDVLRYHEVSESTHRILNPLSADKQQLLGEVLNLGPGMRHLDLACGKGEMLCQYAQHHGIAGVGIDLYAPFIELARQRASELGVASSVTFMVGDAGQPDLEPQQFNVVSCIGATWIAGGLDGTLRLMARWVTPAGWLLVGEPYWIEVPDASLRAEVEEGQGFADLAGTLNRVEAAGTELVEMVLADADDWDRYSASQWRNVADWLLEHADDPDAEAMREMRDEEKRRYLAWQRRYLGWGVFLLRPQ